MAMATDYGNKTLILLGGLAGKMFGRKHLYKLSTGDVREAVKAVDVNHPGFAKYLADSKARGMEFAVFRNRRNIGENELGLGGAREIRIVPVIAGGKRAGTLQTIIGVALIAVATIATGGFGGFAAGGAWGAVGAAGASMAIGGVIQMISPQQGRLSSSSSPENAPSYAFGSARNTTASGNPVPICIGERRWGGMIISASIYAEDKA
ncbi:Phage-related protein, tail component [Pseudomonas sp. NFACC15-1]|jgi:predicted phage tail protein|uniref:tail assembly protein n=1 Tax=unclassified Pseudomonas TaxID=196821 RepID=UPI000881F0C8|nr:MULTISPECIES: tail assembly protein [unclassified Pseudomonas]SDA76819.1 Phage-related protein, tail component [Pseudomonas sp. NFACC15-1]SDY33106.1 Phage-related protein, tail component [Pseudomonas sp. NFACC14]SFA82553.1 Phage-related protein, tail component [Pseudomonas sp. NFIX10]SFE20268.1 Phage-related protein, tail component [Pseudomonas sp. NFACC06-1]